jgi:hypothetical protein
LRPPRTAVCPAFRGLLFASPFINAKLTGQVELSARGHATTEEQSNMLTPNRDRLTAGVDLGDKWSNYCILGLEGEALSEGNSGRYRRISRNSRSLASMHDPSKAAVTLA